VSDAQAPSRAKLTCDGLWKVFGRDPQRVVDSPLGELPRDELLERTGCVAAVRDVSFEVAAGEVFVVMGLSGSGKSTLVRCLTRLIEPTAGHITLDGQDVSGASKAQLRDLRRRSVSMVFQHFGLLPNRRVLDNVAYGLEIQGVDRGERHARARELIELVGLSGFGERYPDELSGGMQQRVGLARALVNEPELLLLDEPFSALDPLIRRDMQAEILRLQQQMHTTMVFITHDLQEALRLGDRIAVMRDGAVVQIGTAAELLASPADDYIADFTADVPRALVLTAADLCRPPLGVPGDEAVGVAGDVDGDTVLRDLIPLVADGEPMRVVSGGRRLGTVTRDAVLRAIYGGNIPELTR
jgi:glycine betaine/proline transport system ATP-binding protein